MDRRSQFQKAAWKPLFIFLLLALGIGIGGYRYSQDQQEQIRQSQQSDLAAHADSKVDLIVAWRKERMKDAQAIMSDRLGALAVQQWMAPPVASGLQAEILDWLSALRQSHGYDKALLMDAQGHILLSSPADDDLSDPHVSDLAVQAAQTQQARLSDLHWNEGTKTFHLNVTAPLISMRDGQTFAVAVVVLEIDPSQTLYPLVQSWPIQSDTGEALLVERDGNDVLYLNELRHQKDTALQLRFPLGTDSLPAAIAARGNEGVVEGLDYRGTAVWAATRTIPDSPWRLVAKVDATEITAPIADRARWVLIVTVVLILASGAATGSVWWIERAAYYRAQYESEYERRVLAQQLESLSRNANDIIILRDLQGNIVQANQRAVEAYGYPLETLLRMNTMKLRPAGVRTPPDALFRQVEESNGLIYETFQQRRDGTTFPVEISSKVIELGGQKLLQAFARDITERKRAEQELERRANEFAALYEINSDLGLQQDLSALLRTILERATTLLDAPNGEILLHDAARGDLELVVSKGLHPPIGTRMALNEGMAGRVAQSRGPLIVDDYFASEFCLPQYRLESGNEPPPANSVLEVPMLFGGQLVGVLGVAIVGRSKRRFTPADARLLSLFAAQAASAVHNARLLDETRANAQQFALLYDAGLTLNRALELRDQLGFLCKIAVKALRADGADFFQCEPNQEHLRLAFSVGHDIRATQLLSARNFSIAQGQGAAGWVAQNRLPLNLLDVTSDERWLGLDHSVRSGVWVPVIHEQKLRGVLGVFSKEVGAFTPPMERLLILFANQVSVAMENARLMEETRRRASQQAALNAIITAATIQSGLDLDALLNIALDRMLQVLGLQMGAIWLRPSINGGVHSVVRGLPEEIGAALLGIIRKQGMEFREATAVSDWHVEDHPFAPVMARFGIRASITVPLQADGRRIGGLNVAAPEPRQWSEEEVALVQAIGQQLGSAIDRMRLFEETRQRLAELEAVNRISTAMRASESVEQMLPILVDETLAVLGIPAVSIWLYEPAQDELRNVIARGWLDQVQTPMKSGEGIGGRVFASGQAYVSREFATDPASRALALPNIPETWGGACVPIRAAHQVIGVLYASVALPREVTPIQVRLLTTIAEMAGNAIHRMRLHEQTVQSLERLTALQAIDTAITSTLDLRATLSVILDHVTSQLGVDAADILLLNRHTLTLEYASGRGFRSRAIERSCLRLGAGVGGQAAFERRLQAIPNLAQADGSFARASLLAGENFVSYYAVPLIAKGQVKGILDIFHRSALDPDSEWLAFLNNLAAQSAIAIDNAELVQDLQHSNVELALAYDTTLEGWVRALDLRDNETEGHTLRVTGMTDQLARAMGIADQDLLHIHRGALLHDIGKMGIPDSILLKPGTLTDVEWAIMRKHPVYAYELLSPVAYLRPALDIPYCHHEKWDGTGYPRGLKGEQIPLAARLFAAVDVWDALRSDRPYRRAWLEAKVRAYLREQAGTHFDPEVIPVFLRLLEQGAG